MPPAKRIDPYGNHNFLVEIDGVTQAGFSEVIMPESSAAVIEYREGGDQTTVRKLPGLIKYGNITLKWGITDSRELYNWWKSVVDGDVQRKTMAIVLLDERRQEKVRWNVVRAWPVKYQPAALQAKGNDVAIETLEITHEGIELA